MTRHAPASMYIDADGYLTASIFEPSMATAPRRTSTGKLFWVGFGGFAAVLAVILATIFVPGLPDEVAGAVLALGLLAAVVGVIAEAAWRIRVMRSRQAVPVDAGPSAELVTAVRTWARGRFDVDLTEAQVVVLLGHGPEIDVNTIVVDGREVMIGTPASRRPDPVYSLIALPAGVELRHR
ncbi:hypothetical protein ACGGZK_03620 [Agromyces sp. MMS24-K17]|uniref:hypothetical protein n=1 Tax=Agromyces sp. MMS24-K17 TaxID=3372850 RepID=UPI003754220C